ncbi:hypothetical protein [Haloarchaeobius amylolyticus]|uniref:hypothetical protein n=1 Tax=Haloarchaeobius amylolyticus TaxID=1198296 RepID=UPI00226F089E|nr:hypothetical protein [Haloarchaeobius amylolyticus]
MDEGQHTDEAVVTVEIPAGLADRIDRLYADCHGYHPSSLQESLTTLCDLASGRLDPNAAERPGEVVDSAAGTTPAETPDGTAEQAVTETADATGAAPDPGNPAGDAPTAEAGPTEPSTGAHPEPVHAAGTEAEAGSATAELASDFEGPHGAGDLDDHIDDAFPARWSVSPAVRRQVRAVVDHFIRDPAESDGPAEREQAALAAVAAREDRSADALHDDLVAALYGNAGLPDDLAAEFFSEALASVVEPEPAVGGQTAGGDAGEDAFGAGALQTGDAFDVDTLLGDVSQPMADCERCGETHPVNDLETVLGSKTATIELLCADCAGPSE